MPEKKDIPESPPSDGCSDEEKEHKNERQKQDTPEIPPSDGSSDDEKEHKNERHSFFDKFKNKAMKTIKKHKKIITTAGIVAGVTVGTAVAVPLAVGALGFGAGGIAAGSAGAWLMSLGGGTTPVIVATMQSIGATGAISASSAIASGAAAGLASSFAQK